jgi:DNA-binding response OmpR family regulator
MARPQEKKVLVVDDEEDVVFFLCTALEDAGFQAEGAFSVDEALAKIKASPPDCVSLDMVMPGKSGIILFHELRRNSRWSKIPVLFVTGHAREEGVRRDLDAAAALAERTLSGPATYLEKPVTAKVFVNAVAAVLKVGLESERETSAPGESALRDEIQGLLRGADAEALRKAIKALKEANRG